MTMQVEFASKDLPQEAGAVFVVPVFEGALEKQLHVLALGAGTVSSLALQVQHAEFKAAPCQVLDLCALGSTQARRIVLVGLGPKRSLDAATLRHALAAGVRAANNEAAVRVLCPDVIKGELVRTLAEGISLGAYRFTRYLTGERMPKRRLDRVWLVRAGRPTASELKALDLGLRVAAAVALARDAVNEPPNVMTPVALAEVAQRIAKRGKLKLTVLDKAGIAKAGMQLHYAVGQGSSNEPRFIHMQYTPKRSKKKVVFVGKGLTFDSGGLCIKPAPGMGEMKSDMGGAAAVLGLMAAVVELQPDLEVHVIVAAAENMPDAAAYRPGDVFGSLDGKTVEIINTDAEGRLVLADALAFARGLSPDLIVDAATLTGACVVALGKNCSAFYTADDKLAKQFSTAARVAGEQFWRMPLLQELREQLNSDIADLKHTGERWGGSITAALFLREFVGEVPWIHCDVAAPVLADSAHGMYPKGGTGHPVLTFVQLLEALA